VALAREVVAWPSAGGGRRPRRARVGLSALGPKADGASFSGREKKNGGGPHEGMGQKQRIRKMGCLNGFEFI
jgi:hypothetical protein